MFDMILEGEKHVAQSKNNFVSKTLKCYLSYTSMEIAYTFYSLLLSLL